MTTLGLQPPSIAALSRIFREKGVARLEPKKKPRAAYRRFVYPAPNACWQLDATQYVLAQGRSCVIFQLQDDHSRLAVASLVATGETSEAALTVVKNGIAAQASVDAADWSKMVATFRTGGEFAMVTSADSLTFETAPLPELACD